VQKLWDCALFCINEKIALDVNLDYLLKNGKNRVVGKISSRSCGFPAFLSSPFQKRFNWDVILFALHKYDFFIPYIDIIKVKQILYKDKYIENNNAIDYIQGVNILIFNKKEKIKMNHPQQLSANMEEIVKALEPLIRRIIREELTRIVKTEPNMFYLDPEMPLYEDMEGIKQRKTQGHIKLHSHEEVWGE